MAAGSVPRRDQARSTPFLMASLVLPTAFWASPLSSWALPSARIWLLPVALPTVCLTLPTASFAVPLILSLVLLMIFLQVRNAGVMSRHKVDPRPARRVSFFFRRCLHALFIEEFRFGFMFARQPPRMRTRFRLWR